MRMSMLDTRCLMLDTRFEIASAFSLAMTTGVGLVGVSPAERAIPPFFLCSDVRVLGNSGLESVRAGFCRYLLKGPFVGPRMVLNILPNRVVAGGRLNLR